MGGDPGAPRMNRQPHPTHVVDAEGRGLPALGTVEHDLDQVGAMVELLQRGCEQAVAVVDADRDA